MSEDNYVGKSTLEGSPNDSQKASLEWLDAHLDEVRNRTINRAQELTETGG